MSTLTWACRMAAVAEHAVPGVLNIWLSLAKLTAEGLTCPVRQMGSMTQMRQSTNELEQSDANSIL